MDQRAESNTTTGLLESALLRCAEVLGDITPDVVKNFYHRHPGTETLFEALYPGRREQLEGEMVQQTLYCFMKYPESQMEIKIILLDTIPHHLETLGVDASLLGGFIAAVSDTICKTIPNDQQGELQTVICIRDQLLEILARGVNLSQHRTI